MGCAPEYKLIIVGGKNENSQEPTGRGSYYFEVQQLIGQLGITDAVVFTGPQQNTVPYLQALDLYVNSSLYEGMSNTLLEAMACGVAIVATNVGGTPFIVNDGSTGLLVPSQPPGEMAKALRRIIQDQALREKLAQNGLRHIQTNHRLESFVATYEELYQEEYMRKLGPMPSSTRDSVTLLDNVTREA